MGVSRSDGTAYAAHPYPIIGWRDEQQTMVPLCAVPLPQEPPCTLSRGWAEGGAAVLPDVVRLWAQCAIGGAHIDCDEYLGPIRAAEYMATGNYHSRHANLLQACKILRQACRDDEGGNASDASAVLNENGDLVLTWYGTFTRNRFLRVVIQTPPGGDMIVSIKWDTGTGRESTYLGLPSMTRDADKPAYARQPDGWYARCELA